MAACAFRKRETANRNVQGGKVFSRRKCRKERFMGLILLVVVILLLVGGLPRWGYSRNWGYGPSGGLGLVLLILILLLLFKRLPVSF
jgi:hypothetical protein